MKHFIRAVGTFVVILLIAPACGRKTEMASPKTEIASSTNKPQFIIAATDLAVPANVGTNGIGSGHDTIVVHMQLSADRTEAFRKFTHEHVNHQTQLVVGSKVIAEPVVLKEITNGRVDVAPFPSADEAQTVLDLLNKE
jgi:preprotein translocase subunit SecD